MHECEPLGCEAHRFMVETVREIKAMNSELTKGQRSLESSVVKLSENLNELHRMNLRIDALMEKHEKKEFAQDAVIAANRDFMNRALGVVALVVLVTPPIISYIIARLFH